MTETGWWILLGVMLLVLCASGVRFDVWWALLRGRMMPPPPPEQDADAGAAPERRFASPGRRAHHAAPHQRPVFHRSGRRG
jgi:hypothetical protein